MSVLRFDSVEKSFGTRRVLDGLSLTVEPGEVYGLLGPNGCGKSTAINMLANLLDPDRGLVEIAGEPPSRGAKRNLGLCPQEIALYRDLYPAENLRFFAEVHGLSRAAVAKRVAELMQLFELEPFAKTPVSALSGGWQRRVNIAVALVHSPAILVLDEPTSAVDLEARHDLWKMIESLRGSGITVLLTTHHLDEAERLCSRVGIMKDGRIAREGTVEELLARVPGQAVALIESKDERAVVTRVEQLGWVVRHYASRLACLLPRQVSLRSVVEALADVEVSAVSIQRVTLEHAYLEVTQGEQGRLESA
jgi:ABC-2 type transport system ATP-binding protein